MMELPETLRHVKGLYLFHHGEEAYAGRDEPVALELERRLVVVRLAVAPVV